MSSTTLPSACSRSLRSLGGPARTSRSRLAICILANISSRVIWERTTS